MEKKLFTGEIIDVKKTHAIVMNNEGEKALLHISEVSDYYIQKISSMFKLRTEHTFEILGFKDGLYRVSWKNLNPRYLKNPFKFELKEVGTGIEGLRERVNKELDND